MTNEEFEAFLRDMGFSSKEDLEAIKASPALLRYMNAVQAGVTKKFQGSADEKKQLSDQLELMRSQLQELMPYVERWEKWAGDNADFLETYETFQKGKTGARKMRQREDGNNGDDDRFEKFMRSVEQEKLEFQRQLKAQERMINLYIQLGQLQSANPKMDVQKVLDIALKKGYSNLKDAYNDEEAYGKELFEKRAQEIADGKVKEELAKRGTNLETGSGVLGDSHFELPKINKEGETKIKADSSMESVGLEFLKERQQELNKPAA